MKAASDTHFYHRLLKPESLFICILLATLILRFAFLDLKLYHHDEAVHAWFAYQLLTKGTYVYNPVFHGPFLFYVTAGLFSIFGDFDLVGRLLPAFLGTLLVALVYPLYRMGYLDGKQMLVAALFLALSPNMVYFSRFLRNDIFIAFFSLLLVVAALAYFNSGKLRFALVAGLAAALGMSSKENMPIVLVIFGTYLIYCLWTRRLVFPRTWRRDILLATALSGGVIALFYSSFGAHPEIVLQAGQMAISHWTEMHGIQRLAGPWFFYLILFVLYEVPIILLAGMGFCGCVAAYVRSQKHSPQDRVDEGDPSGLSKSASLIERISSSLRRPESGVAYDPKTEFIRFSLWWMIASLAVYAYIGEKVPWLILHQLLPMVFVATYRLDRLKIVIVALGTVLLLGMTLHVAFTPGDIAEPIVQVQNSEDLRLVMQWIDESDRIAIATDTIWPLNWYYRDDDRWSKITYFGGKSNKGSLVAGNYDLIITHDKDSYDEIPGFEKTTLKHSYWVTYYEVKGDLIRYYFTRNVEVGSKQYDLFRSGASF